MYIIIQLKIETNQQVLKFNLDHICEGCQAAAIDVCFAGGLLASWHHLLLQEAFSFPWAQVVRMEVMEVSKAVDSSSLWLEQLGLWGHPVSNDLGGELFCMFLFG